MSRYLHHASTKYMDEVLAKQKKIETQRSKQTSNCNQRCCLVVNNVGENHGSNHGKDNKRLVFSSHEKKEKDKQILLPAPHPGKFLEQQCKSVNGQKS